MCVVQCITVKKVYLSKTKTKINALEKKDIMKTTQIILQVPTVK